MTESPQQLTPQERFRIQQRFRERFVNRQGADPSVIESQGGTAWAKFFYPHLFTRDFTFYQKDFWEWGWQIEPNKYYRPRIECEPRGVGKSTSAEALAVSFIARKRRSMIGYLSLEETKATKHFDSIKSMLESPKLLEHYPHCRPKVQTIRDVAHQWSREAIVTDSDAMIVPLTLLGSSRGWKSSTGQRFDVLFLDDIDKLGLSTEFVRKLIDMLKGEILAAGDDNTVVIMPENLIYRDSICSQILDHRADILSDRIFCGPYPLLKEYEAEKIDIPGDKTGAKQWIITAGEPLDPAIDIAYAEKLLNKFGKVTFDRECQQKVFEVEDDKDFREWSEPIHLITASEFRRTMLDLGEDVWNESRQCLKIPTRWRVGIGLDWGTTRGHPSVAAFVARPSELSPMSDCHFVFAEVVLPKFPIDSHEKADLVSPGRVAAAMQSVLDEWNVMDSQVQVRLMSHEASAALNTFQVDLADDLKTFFGKWKAQKGSGVPQIQNLLEVDHKADHPFRRYPQGCTRDGHDLSGLPLVGRPRLYFIVDDSQGELRFDNYGGMYVTGAKNARGFARARFEMPLYSHKNSGQNKIDDDFVDAFRGLMNIFGVSADPKSDVEKLLENMPPQIRTENIQTAEQMMGRQMYLDREFKKLEERRVSDDLAMEFPK